VTTVVETVAKLIEEGEIEFDAKWLSGERYAQIAAAVRQFGQERLKPVKEALPEEITYGEIRLVAAHLRVGPNRKSGHGRGEFEPRCSAS
jgi:uncharacterized protein YpbB